MYAILELQTNKNGVMSIVEPIFKTDNPIYAQNKIYTIAASAVTSNLSVHTVICIDSYGKPCFNTPMSFEHIDEV